MQLHWGKYEQWTVIIIPLQKTKETNKNHEKRFFIVHLFNIVQNYLTFNPFVLCSFDDLLSLISALIHETMEIMVRATSKHLCISSLIFHFQYVLLFCSLQSIFVVVELWTMVCTVDAFQVDYAADNHVEL